MNEKFTGNGNVRVWAVPVSGIANYKAPTAAEVNAGLDITDAIAWDSTTIPTATDSEDQDDRSLRDKGNATTRGSASYEATLNLFYPKDNRDATSDYGKAYQFFRVPRVPCYLVTAVTQAPEGKKTPVVAGDWISVYRFMSDGWTDDIEGDDSNKYAVAFLTQGEVAVYTQVKNSTPVSVALATGAPTSIAVGKATPLRATLGGKRANAVVDWISSDTSKVTVSPNGVAKGVAVGTATITATHPAAGGTAGPGVSITVTA